jgi:DNA-directed RNA polymerase subunit RPC12/RpoP
MPIRFRCAYCSQLMSIARRKAGLVVRCPKCAGEIIVPSPDATAPVNPAVFEAENFDVQLETAGEPNAPPSTMVHPPPPVDAPRPAGVFVPMGMLIVFLLVTVLLLVLMLVIGLIIGRQSAVPG